MKYILLLSFLLFPNYALAEDSSESTIVANVEEKFKKIQKAENIFLLRMTILNDSLTMKELELRNTKDSYRKTLLSEEIVMIKENIEREEISLRNKIDVIENGLKPPVPTEVTTRINKAKDFFKYFRKKE